MPIYCFKCEEGHVKEIFRDRPYKNKVRYRCKKCGLWMYRNFAEEHRSRKVLFVDKNNDPLSHQVTKRSFSGAWVEHLTPEPVFVKNEREYSILLEKTHSVEKPR